MIECIILGLPRPEVRTRATLAYTLLGEDHSWGPITLKAHPQDRDLHVRWSKKITDLLARGQIKVLKH